MTSAMRWSRSVSGTKPARSLPELHNLLAQYLWDTVGWQALGVISTHFVRGDDPEKFAQVLATCAKRGDDSEADLFCARAVLQSLAVGRVDNAKGVLKSYPVAMGNPGLFNSPLLHLCAFLLDAVERQSPGMVGKLRSTYAPSLARDPMLGKLFQRVDQVFFGRRGGGGDMGGLMGDLMKMLGGDFEDD